MESIEALLNIAPFKKIERDDIKRISCMFKLVTFPEYTELINQKEKVNMIGLIKKGRAKLYLNDHEDDRVIFETLSKGDIFGEMAVFPDKISLMGVYCDDRRNWCLYTSRRAVRGSTSVRKNHHTRQMVESRL